MVGNLLHATFCTKLVSLEPFGHLDKNKLEVQPKCFFKRYLAYALHPLHSCKISFENGIWYETLINVHCLDQREWRNGLHSQELSQGNQMLLFHTHFICGTFFWRISIKLSSCVFILYRVGRQRITALYPPFWNLFRSTIDHNSVQAYVSALKMLLHGTWSLWEISAAQTSCVVSPMKYYWDQSIKEQRK